MNEFLKVGDGHEPNSFNSINVQSEDEDKLHSGPEQNSENNHACNESESHTTNLNDSYF